MDAQTDRYKDRCTDGQITGPIKRQTDGQADRKMCGQTN